VAWDFFYGIVNFDGVFGTMNHYGTVDMFAGRYNDAYRKAELDYYENIETPKIRETFKAILDDWTNDGFDPFASPHETGSAFGIRHGSNTEAITRRRVAAARMVNVPGDEQLRSDENGHPVNRMFADVGQDEPEIEVEPGFEDQVAAFSYSPTCRVAGHLEPVGGQHGKNSLMPDHRGTSLPIIHGNDRVVRPALRRDPLGRRGPGRRWDPAPAW
jgi:hypothetical protein